MLLLYFFLDVDECESTPCKNGGTCLNEQPGYSCRCKDGYQGQQCQEGIHTFCSIIGSYKASGIGLNRSYNSSRTLSLDRLGTKQSDMWCPPY